MAIIVPGSPMLATKRAIKTSATIRAIHVKAICFSVSSKYIMKDSGFWREMLSMISEQNITMQDATISRYAFPNQMAARQKFVYEKKNQELGVQLQFFMSNRIRTLLRVVGIRSTYACSYLMWMTAFISESPAWQRRRSVTVYHYLPHTSLRTRSGAIRFWECRNPLSSLSMTSSGYFKKKGPSFADVCNSTYQYFWTVIVALLAEVCLVFLPWFFESRP